MLAFTVGKPMRLAAAALLTAFIAPSVAPAQATPLPPAKDLIAKFVAATNAGPVMAKYQSVRTKGRFEMAAVQLNGEPGKDCEDNDERYCEQCDQFRSETVPQAQPCARGVPGLVSRRHAATRPRARQVRSMVLRRARLQQGRWGDTSLPIRTMRSRRQ